MKIKFVNKGGIPVEVFNKMFENKERKKSKEEKNNGE